MRHFLTRKLKITRCVYRWFYIFAYTNMEILPFSLYYDQEFTFPNFKIHFQDYADSQV